MINVKVKMKINCCVYIYYYDYDYNLLIIIKTNYSNKNNHICNRNKTTCLSLFQCKPEIIITKKPNNQIDC